MTILATVTDPDGRLVQLTKERWAHILFRHPELCNHSESVLQAVRSPVKQLDGRQSNEHWYYSAASGLSGQRLKVVVAFRGDGVGFIVTAFPRSRFP